MFTFFKELWQLIKMLFSSKPSDQTEVELLAMEKFPFKGYRFMMWCGKMIYRSDSYTEEEMTEYLATDDGKISKTHETIHLCQAQIKGKWIKYYWKYVCEWIKGNPITNPASSAYHTIPYEMEAYGNERDETYITNYTGCYLWCYDIDNRKKTYKANKFDWRAYCRSIEKKLKEE